MPRAGWPCRCAIESLYPVETVAWSSSQYATFYSVDVYYSAYNGSTYLGSADTSLFPTGTSAVIPQAFFRKYGSATYVSAGGDVDACNGPRPGPGENGNITGEFKGFFFGIFSDSTSYANFYMGAPKFSSGAAPPPPRISREERRERLLKAFKAKFQSEAD